MLPEREGTQVVSVDDVRLIASGFPRAYEVLVRDRVKFRVGRIVFAALSHDETVLGFGFPRDERAALVESDPVKFHFPRPSDMRYQWVEASMARLGDQELSELLTGAWAMCVSRFLREDWFRNHP